jgi:hypothetical protein
MEPTFRPDMIALYLLAAISRKDDKTSGTDLAPHVHFEASLIEPLCQAAPSASVR